MKYSISVTFSEIKATHKLLGKMTNLRKQDMGLIDHECDESLQFYCKLDSLVQKIKNKRG